MNNKTLMLVAIALVASVAAGFVIAEEVNAAAVADCTPKEGNVSAGITEKTVAITADGSVAFDLLLNGPVSDGALSLADFWFAAANADPTGSGEWTKVYSSSVNKVPVRGVTFDITKVGQTYDYTFKAASIPAGVKNILLCFTLQAYTGSLDNGVELENYTQRVYYNITFTDGKSEDLKFDTGSVSYQKGVTVGPDNKITEDVTNEPSKGKWYAIGLPAGLTMNSAGVIFGTATTVNESVNENVTLIITKADKVYSGKITVKVTASNDPKFTLSNVTGARALTSAGSNAVEDFLTYSNTEVQFKINATNVNSAYSYSVYAVNDSGEVVVTSGPDSQIKADGEKTFSFTPKGQGEFAFKIKLFDASGAVQYDSDLLFNLLVIQKVQDVEAGIVFTPTLTPGAGTVS